MPEPGRAVHFTISPTQGQLLCEVLATHAARHGRADMAGYQAASAPPAIAWSEAQWREFEALKVLVEARTAEAI